MQAGALRPYELALAGSHRLGVRAQDGRTFLLDVARWLAPADAADYSVIDRCVGPTLDIGCGPGRFVAALAERGVAAMGLDIAETAVSLARRRGAPALMRTVFARLPGEGRWPTVLLMDGNIGIGGDPSLLLRRVRALLGPSGRLVVEAHADADLDERLSVQFLHDGRPIGPSFPWAHVGLTALCEKARCAGYSLDETWSSDERSFASFVR